MYVKQTSQVGDDEKHQCAGEFVSTVLRGHGYRHVAAVQAQVCLRALVPPMCSVVIARRVLCN
jgi:hypothetical protein